MTNSKECTGKVFAVCISEKKGTKKISVPGISLNARGIMNDAHAGLWDRQVSMLTKESIDTFNQTYNRQLGPGSFAENITTYGIDLTQVQLLDRFIIGKTELEVTQIGKECHGKNCTIFTETGDCIMPKQGLFLRVIKEGKIVQDNPIIHYPRIFRFKVITLSDKCAAGECTDTSAPEILSMLAAHYSTQKRKIASDYVLIPDDRELLTEELLTITNAVYDVIFTTGGTGIGPRDITPEVVLAVCDKILPGVMDAIRLKYGQTNPRALLSRSVAGVSKQTLILALPGSPRAVKEYMTEIVKLLDHMIFMLHGLGH